MPLYKKSFKKPLFSQEFSSSSESHSKSQKPIEDIIESLEKIENPCYPKVITRNASETEAFDKFGNENKEPLLLRSDRKRNYEEYEKEILKSRISTQNYEDCSYISGGYGDISISTDDLIKSTKVEINNVQEQSRKKNQVDSISKKNKVENTKKKCSNIKNVEKKSIISETSKKKKNSQKSMLNKMKKSFYLNEPNDTLNSSVSSQISINDPTVKEAYTNFMLRKTKKDKNMNSSQSSDISLNDPLFRETYTQFLTKKTKFARVNTPKNLEPYEKMKWLQEQRVVGVYVHCDRCDKIRYLDDIQDPTLLPDKWYCEDNKDKEYNDCEIPEEKFPAYIKEDWIDNLYNAGSIVWAKVEGFPWWPAMVDDDPDTESYYLLENDINNTPTHYHVTFFDIKKVEREWLEPKYIKSFYKERNNPNLVKKKGPFNKEIAFAIIQANEALNMPLRERLEKFSFISRYNPPIKTAKEKKQKRSNIIMDNSEDGKSKSLRQKKINKSQKFKPIDLIVEDFELAPSTAIEDISLELFDVY